MPFKEHPVFIKPQNADAKIWRYMDFTKLVSLLDRKALYFTRADLLAQKFDKYECLYLPEFINGLLEKCSDEKARKRVLNIFSASPKEFRKYNVVNCWHINENESAAMWRIYSDRGYGLAIQSRYKRLIDSFDVYQKNDVFVGKVIYYSGRTEMDAKQLSNAYSAFLIKRKCFEYENELRAVILNIWSDHEKQELDMNRTSHEGEYIPVNLGILLENIYLAPNTENWIYELTRSVLDRFGINVPVQRSILDAEPY